MGIREAALAGRDLAIDTRGGAQPLGLLAGAVGLLDALADLVGDVGVTFVLVGRGLVGLRRALGRSGGTGARQPDPREDAVFGHGLGIPGRARGVND